MAAHSSVLVWRIPGTGQPGGLPSMGSHRVGHDWSDLAAAAVPEVGVNLATSDVCPTQRETWENGLPWGRLFLRFGSIIESCCCSVKKWCTTLCDLIDGSMPGFPVLHYLPEVAQTLVHWVGDAIQPSHPLSSPSPPALNLSQHQGLFQWVGSLDQVAKVLELQHQCQSFQWIFRVYFL